MKAKKIGGLITADMVEEGTELTLVDDIIITEKMTEKGNQTYRSIKVLLPNGEEKLANVGMMSWNSFIDVFGDETELWAGKKVRCEIKSNQKGKYVVLMPSEKEISF